MTKKQYSKPQVIEVGDAIKMTKAYTVGGCRETVFNSYRILFC